MAGDRRDEPALEPEPDPHRAEAEITGRQRGDANGAHGTAIAAQQVPASVALARGFLFVVFEQLPEVGNGKIIRKVVAVPRNYALVPANPLGTLTIAEHVRNLNPGQSPYLSASEKV